MLYIFMGQSCTGKSTVAEKLKEFVNAEVYTGKDYLRMGKTKVKLGDYFMKSYQMLPTVKIYPKKLLFII